MKQILIETYAVVRSIKQMISRRDSLAMFSVVGVMTFPGCTGLLNGDESNYTYQITVLNATKTAKSITVTATTDDGETIISANYNLAGREGIATDRFTTVPDRIRVVTEDGQSQEFFYDSTNCPGKNATLTIHLGDEILAAGTCGTVTNVE